MVQVRFSGWRVIDGESIFGQSRGMGIKEPILRTRDLTKGFGALKAVNRINLDPFAGRLATVETQR